MVPYPLRWTVRIICRGGLSAADFGASCSAVLHDLSRGKTRPLLDGALEITCSKELFGCAEMMGRCSAIEDNLAI
jgi:hypothetical protein